MTKVAPASSQVVSSQATDSSCAPCARNDEAAIVDFLDDTFDDVDSNTKGELIRLAKDKWAKQHYGAGFIP